MNKNLWSFIVLLVLSLVAGTTAQESMSLQQYQQTVNSVISSLPPDKQNEPALTRNIWRESSDAYKKLTAAAPDMWKQILENINTITPTTAERAVVFQSFESLPPKDYLEFVGSAFDLVEHAKISPLEFESVFFPTGRMQFFLDYNYDAPEVKALLEKIQKARVSESIASNVGDFISGKQKQRAIAVRNAHPEIAKPVPLLSGGYAAPDPATSMTPDPVSAPLWLNAQKASGQNASAPISPNKQSTPSLKPTQPPSSSPIVPVGILVLAIIGVAVFFLRRKSS